MESQPRSPGNLDRSLIADTSVISPLPLPPSPIRRLPRAFAPLGDSLGNAGVYDSAQLAVLRSAYDKACDFFQRDLSLRQKREVALAILLHARRGLIDPHRLATKGIVAVSVSSRGRPAQLFIHADVVLWRRGRTRNAVPILAI